MRGNFHEVFEAQPAAQGSDKGFCLTFAAVFAIAAVLGAGGLRLLCAGMAASFLLLAYARPTAAAPLNRAWLRLGAQLHRITNPVLLTLLYTLTILPLGLCMRLLGKGRTPAPDAAAASYWLPRENPDSQSMRNQF